MIAEVIVDIANSNVDKIFDYIADDNTKVGSRVSIPFGTRHIDGYVIALKQSSDVSDDKLKKIGPMIDDYPVLTNELIELGDHMCKLNHLRRIDCMRLFVPSQLRSAKTKPLLVNYVRVMPSFNKDELLSSIRANAKKQRDMIEYLELDQEYPKAELNKYFGANNIARMINNGYLQEFTKHKLRTPYIVDKQDKQVQLSPRQQGIVDDILKAGQGVHLIFGVTGSGKTEVYMHIISNILQQGKNAIMLVPEISLTPQVMGNFKARFGNNVALLHSGLSDGEKFDEWQRIREGNVRIVIGARSAIFAPLENIGVIILDEEHDPSYKSESNPRYLTHDVAKFRAKYNCCPLVLGSATPALESFYAAKQQEYMLHELPERANKRAMPSIQVVNMCNEMLNGNLGMFSAQLMDDLHKCVEQNNQAMLFINRRGHSSYMICRECGYIPKCEDCDVSLVYHSEDNQLKCHYCSKRYKALTNCPQCGSSYIRYGIMGTQRVVQELQKEFPNVKILRMDNDTTSNKNALTDILQEFANTKPCILVGTQMIAKGHDFPDVTLVGVMNADMSLHYSDYRSVERTFELITQVSGRAGRADKTGKVIIQTYTPNHYLYRFVANYNYEGFFNKEINLRHVTAFPPFAKILRILVSSEKDEKAQNAIIEIHKQVKELAKQYPDDFLYCEAMKSPLSRIQKKYRYQVLMRFSLKHEQQIVDEIYKIVDSIKIQGIQSFIEVNPSNMS